MSIWAGILNVINGKVDVGNSYSKKIDDETVLGLVGVNNSLAYKVHEIEKHLHNQEKWFGLKAVANAEINVADRMDGAVLPFRLTAGNKDFGSWVQVLGSGDTPVIEGNVKFDLHRFVITSTNSTSPFIIQIVKGESADIASKVLADDLGEFPYIAATNNNDSGISDVLDNKVLTGEKLWARCACVGANGTIIDFYYGIHEYPG